MTNPWLELSRWQSRGNVRVREVKPGIWECNVLELDDVNGPTFGAKGVGATAEAAVSAALEAAA